MKWNKLNVFNLISISIQISSNQQINPASVTLILLSLLISTLLLCLFNSYFCQVLAPVVRRLPRRVQAKQRYFIYDNCCASHKSALRRFPHRVRHWTFVIDRTHYKNHTACHSGYNMDEFPQLKNVNSQQAEQINRSLRSLATVLAHYKWETYLKVLELFFVRRNIRMKKQ